MQQPILYGAYWSGDYQRAKQFLQQEGIEVQLVDVHTNQKALNRVQQGNNGRCILPTLELEGVFYPNPSNEDLLSLLKVQEKREVLFYGTRTCPDCRAAKQYLQVHEVDFTFYDIEEEEKHAQQVEAVNEGKQIIPTIFINGQPFSNPDTSTLEKALHINEADYEHHYQAIIIGGGPTGLTTALYLQRAHYSTLILEKQAIGGNAFDTKSIKNYPGFESISGPQLIERMQQQVEQLGVVIRAGEEVTNIQKSGKKFEITTPIATYKAQVILIATGSYYRRLGIPNEQELTGESIHFCSTCDGAKYDNKKVIVIGGGRSALEESYFLSQSCKDIVLVNNSEEFDADKNYIDKAEKADNVEILYNKETVQFVVDEQDNFKGLKIKDKESGEEETIEAAGAFIFAGLVPNTQHFEGFLTMDEQGYIITTGQAKSSIEGIFAAGECRQGAIAQVAAAAGEGVMASYGMEEYLEQS